MTVAPPAVRRDLSALFAPASVAIVGASEDPAKWGNWLARGAVRAEGRRTVHLVNRRGGEVLGRATHRSLADLPEPPDLVVLAVPAAAMAQCVDDAIAAGARAIVAIAAGEADGDAGGPLDAAIAASARNAGVVLLGPNCLGVFDAGQALELVPNDLPHGSIGMLSQSGNLALEVGILAAEAGLGFSRFVSVGNQADLETAELMAELAAHPETELIAVYAEDFRDGRAFVRAARAAGDAGKPVVLMAIESTEATARAVRSHTGALASDAAAIDAACRAAGIERVRSPQELVDVADGLLRAGPARGRRIAVLADGGGHGGIAAGLAQAAGLELPALSEALAAEVRAGLPPTAGVSNPIDLAGGGEQDIHTFDRTARALLRSGEVDALLMTGYFGGYSQYSDALGRGEASVAEALADVARTTGRPLVAQTMHPDSAAAEALRAGGVPVYRTIERAAEVLGRLADHGARELEALSELPPPADRLTAGGYAGARALLEAGGVPFAGAATVTTDEEAVEAAKRLGYPVVLKALGLLHKSDAGGVVVGLRGEEALRSALADVRAPLQPAAVSVEQMAPVADGVELLIGARWDARFGPIALVGLGGVHTETLRDVAVALAPLDEEHAHRLLLTLRGASLLQGARGRPPMDVAAAAHALAALSRVAAAHPEIAEIEVNPLLVLPSGALGLDARIVLAPEGAS
jgi:acyl-CoA synthetase (NDP forming)